jgi:hypothetical protein
MVMGIIKGIMQVAPDLHDTIKKLAGDATKTAQRAFLPIGDVARAAFKTTAAGGLAPTLGHITKLAPPNAITRSYFDPGALGMVRALGIDPGGGGGAYRASTSRI